MAPGNSGGAAGWAEVDWTRPWLAPYREIGLAASEALTRGASVAEALESATPLTLTTAGLAPAFVPAEERPATEPYEAFIARTGRVPTRDNLHDLLNGLVWLRFPHFKRSVSILHAEQIALHGVAGARGAMRDALTLLDENGAVWAAPAASADLLRRRQWKTLFSNWTAAAGACPVLLVGHALLEKLVRPRKTITAHVWTVSPRADAASAVATPEAVAGLFAQPRCPLPVLGIPGWWAPNQTAGFYDDPAVFRALGQGR